MTGRVYSEEHRRNISEGRKKTLETRGGFSEEHLANLTSVNRRNGILRRLQCRLHALLNLQHELALVHQRSPESAGEGATGEHLRTMSRRKAKRHYDEKIASDVEIVYCSFCDTFHTILRRTYEAKIARNGRYVCGREGGKIGGSRPKARKTNPCASEGMKECAKCHNVLPLDAFHHDKTRPDGRCGRCKECRAGKSHPEPGAGELLPST
jgi:hypothetical protein